MNKPSPMRASPTASLSHQSRVTPGLLNDADVPSISACLIARVSYVSAGPSGMRESSGACAGPTGYIHPSVPTATRLFSHFFSILHGNPGTHTSLSTDHCFSQLLRATLPMNVPVTRPPCQYPKSYVLRKSSQVCKCSGTFWPCLMNHLKIHSQGFCGSGW